MPQSPDPTAFPTIAVLGFGAMGSGIAQACAEHGLPVMVLDTDSERLAAGMATVASALDKALSSNRLTVAKCQSALATVTVVTAVSDLAASDIVIEAVVEDPAIKADLLRNVADVVGDDTIILTCTSSLSVTQLARNVSNPGRFAGMHFFHPEVRMKLVEVVRALQTADATIENAIALANQIGKTPIVVKDRPGFLVNRVLIPYLNDVIQAYDDGLSSACDLDTALELGLGYPMGPLALLDFVGLDVHLQASEAAWQATGDQHFAPPPLLRAMVDAGYVGRQGARGFRAEAP